MNMDHSEDPRELTEQAVGNVRHIEVFGPRVLVATYMRPERTKGGIILTGAAQKEDEFQGKVGLVLKVGNTAFRNDSATDFGGDAVKEGDWVYYRPADGLALQFNGKESRHCRILQDVDILGTVQNPDQVY